MQSVAPLEQLEEGSVYTTQSQVLGVKIKAVNHVVDYIQDEQLGIRNKTGMIQYSAQFKLSKRGDKTLVTSSVSVSSQSKAFAFAEPMLKQLARRELRADLEALKNAVEQKLQP